MDQPDNIPQDLEVLRAFVWSLCADFVNEQKPGSVTVHFGPGGRFEKWEQKLAGRF